jgi:hypothetical protein
VSTLKRILKHPLYHKPPNALFTMCLRAELGRAAWKVLHTMTLRFPEVSIVDVRIIVVEPH